MEHKDLDVKKYNRHEVEAIKEAILNIHKRLLNMEKRIFNETEEYWEIFWKIKNLKEQTK